MFYNGRKREKLAEGMIAIGKIMILSFSDSEEHIFNKVKEVLNSETVMEYTGELSEPVLSFQGLEIHLKDETVCQNGRLVNLSHQEFLALEYLAEHPGWIHTKEQIYDTVYGDKFEGNVDNTVYCLIYSLRKKLEKDPRYPKYIQTVRGVGYKFIGKTENPGM